MRRSRVQVLGPALLLTVGGLYAMGSVNWCGSWQPGPPRLVGSADARGPLRAGAGRVDLVLPYPVVRAGYGPPRDAAVRSDTPLCARALVFEAEGMRLALVLLDLLLVPASLRNELRAASASLGVTQLTVVASHAHSSVGGFDERLAAQLLGTGRFDPAVRSAVFSAASAALEKAVTDLRPATWRRALSSAAPFNTARSGTLVDERLWMLDVRGTDGRPLAKLLGLAAHPTVAPRGGRALDGDYPGRLAARLETEGQGVTFVLQTAVGNASVEAHRGDPASASERLFKLLPGPNELTPMADDFGFAVVEQGLPRPDASRLVPSILRGAGDNLLCRSTDRTFELVAWRLGELRLLFAPFEVTHGGATALHLDGGQGSVVSLANGYLGYLEAEPVVAVGDGESHRQYFGPKLVALVESASGAALAALAR